MEKIYISTTGKDVSIDDIRPVINISHPSKNFEATKYNSYENIFNSASFQKALKSGAIEAKNEAGHISANTVNTKSIEDIVAKILGFNNTEPDSNNQLMDLNKSDIPESLQSTIKNLYASYNLLKNNLTDSQIELTGLKEVNNKITETDLPEIIIAISNINSAIETFKSIINTKVNNIQEIINNIQKGFTENKEQVENIQQGFTENKEQVEALSTEIKDRVNSITKDNKKLSNDVKELQKIPSEISDLNNKLTDNYNNLTEKFTEQINQLNVKIPDIEKVNEVYKQLSIQNEKFNQLDAVMEKMDKSIGDRILDINNRIDEQELQTKALSEKIDQSNEAILSNSKKIDELISKITNNDTYIKEALVTVNNLSKSVSGINSSLTDLKTAFNNVSGFKVK